MRFIKTFFVTLLLTMSTLLNAQPTITPDKDADYHLGIDYGVNFLNGSMKLSEFYTTTDVQTKLKNFWNRCKHKGWTDSEIMSTYFMEAAYADAFWAGANGWVHVDMPMAAANIHIPTGKFLITTNLLVATGIYSGEGSRFCDISAYGHSFGSTELVMDHVNWKSKYFPEKVLMKAVNWGSEDALAGWLHHTIVKNIHFNGARRQKNLVLNQPLTALMAIWDFGEASGVYNCYFTESEGDGLLMNRATPAHIVDCSFFTNNGHGASCMGSGAYNFVGPSGDENGMSLIGGLPGYGRPGNGTITITGFKYETGTSPNAFRPFDGQPFLSLEGWWTVSINGGTFAATSLVPYCFIRVKGTLNTSSIKWDGVQFFGNSPKCILYDESTDTEYLFNGDAYNTTMDNGTWHTTYGLKNTWPIIINTNKRTSKGILQHVGTDGATSWSTAGIYNPYGAATPPPVTCTWVLGSTYTLGPCVNGTQQKTTPYVSSLSGCTPTTAKPADKVESIPCSVAPVSAIPANSVLVLYDTDEAGSQIRANSYASTWGIPTANIVGVAMGESHDLGTTDTKLNSVRTTIANSGKQWCVLVWDTPSRAGSMSITSALTLGRVTAYNSRSGALPTSALYNYTGITPKTDKGLVPCFQLHSLVDFTTNSSKASSPKGQIYMLAANDGGGTAPRGDSRANQMQALDPTTGYVFIDNRKGCPGECDGNNLIGKSDVLSYFGSMYKLTKLETNTIMPGAFCDYVTSTAGNLPDGLGQTPITYALSNKFIGVGGTVVEPYQSGGTGASAGWLAEQFVNIQIFSSNYYGTAGKSLAQSVWSSVKCPGRYLVLGDPLCTPKGIPSNPVVTPPPSTSVTLTSNPVIGDCFKYTIPNGGWVNAKKIEITGLKHKYSNGSRFICFNQDQTMRLVVDGKGAIWVGDTRVYNDGTLLDDVANNNTLVFTFPTTTIIRMGDSNMSPTDTNCNGFTGTWTSLKVIF